MTKTDAKRTALKVLIIAIVAVAAWFVLLYFGAFLFLCCLFMGGGYFMGHAIFYGLEQYGEEVKEYERKKERYSYYQKNVSPIIPILVWLLHPVCIVITFGIPGLFGGLLLKILHSGPYRLLVEKWVYLLNLANPMEKDLIPPVKLYIIGGYTNSGLAVSYVSLALFVYWQLWYARMKDEEEEKEKKAAEEAESKEQMKAAMAEWDKRREEKWKREQEQKEKERQETERRKKESEDPDPWDGGFL